jgi:hypothetical protein
MVTIVQTIAGGLRLKEVIAGNHRMDGNMQMPRADCNWGKVHGFNGRQPLIQMSTPCMDDAVRDVMFPLAAFVSRTGSSTSLRQTHVCLRTETSQADSQNRSAALRRMNLGKSHLNIACSVQHPFAVLSQETARDSRGSDRSGR